MGGCGSHCPPDHSNQGAVLHTMLALLSTGPVGFSDAPGHTNASLIMRTCNAAGALLQPSRPITAVDGSFDATPGAAPQGGHVLSTHTAIQGRPAMYFLLGHSLSAPYTPRLLDLWPTASLAPAAQLLAVPWLALGACAAASPAPSPSPCPALTALALPSSAHAPLSPQLSLPAVGPGEDTFTPTLVLLAPVCGEEGGGLTFFGEWEKIAPISQQRFPALACAGGGLDFAIAGVAGERVSVAWAPTGGSLAVGSYTFPSATPRAMAACTATAAAGLACTPA